MGNGSRVGVTGKEGMERSRAMNLRSKRAGACSSAPTTPTGTMGAPASSARRMKPWPKGRSL